MSLLLQKIIFPKINVCTEEALYFRGQGSRYDYGAQSLSVPKNEVVSFNSFFNIFSIFKWKKYTTLSSLFLNVQAQGSGNITIKHVERGVVKVLSQHEYISTEHCVNDIEIDISNIHFGYVYVEWQSIEDSVLTSFQFYTQDVVDVSSMALVITTFNREAAVTKTINRINNELLNNDEFKGQFKLIVVNNGSDFDSVSGDDIAIIKNENLGGSGGFMRGLIEAQGMTSVKHVIFMDDDGSCEIDSIVRTHAFLLLAKDTNTVITACMMFEDEPAIIHESGAVWQKDFLHYPAKHRLDVRKVSNLESFDDEIKIGYGGWWFLAFHVNSIEHYSFPFFVRGDDLLFGYMHKKHNIVTLNGVASWQMDFERKISVLNNYLNFRTVAVPALVSDRKYSSLFLTLFFIRELALVTFACRYELAKAIIMSYNDCMKGQDFWVNNADCIQIRQRINSITKNEKYSSSDVNIVNGCIDYPSVTKESRLHKIFRLFTLNGHLIPSFFFYSKPIAVDYRHRHPTKYSFLRKTIYNINIENGNLIELTHSKIDFFKIISLGFLTAIKNLIKFSSVRKEMKKNLPYLTSKEFWTMKFNKKN